MPNGISHASASVLIAWSPWVVWMANNVRPIVPAVTIETAFGISIGALLGIFLTPDLDVEERTYGKGILWRSSCLVGAAWSLLWQPYGAIIQHRSILSHMPILGTLLRLAYLVGVPLLVWTLLAGALHWPRPDAYPVIWWLEHQGHWFVIGLAASDAAHWFMDWMF